jgi:ABC-type glycerol-3-phosphate transport system substrate-binding protein
MRRTAIAMLLAALALGACGGGDENDDSGGSTAAQETQTQTTETTDTTTTSGGGGARQEEISSCLDREGLNVIENPGSQVDAEYQLVVNSGGGGVLYGFADESAAQASKAKVQKYEGSSGRKTEVIGDTVLAYFPDDQTLANPEATDKVRKCAG